MLTWPPIKLYLWCPKFESKKKINKKLLLKLFFLNYAYNRPPTPYTRNNHDFAYKIRKNIQVGRYVKSPLTPFFCYEWVK